MMIPEKDRQRFRTALSRAMIVLEKGGSEQDAFVKLYETTYPLRGTVRAYAFKISTPRQRRKGRRANAGPLRGVAKRRSLKTKRA